MYNKKPNAVEVIGRYVDNKVIIEYNKISLHEVKNTDKILFYSSKYGEKDYDLAKVFKSSIGEWSPISNRETWRDNDMSDEFNIYKIVLIDDFHDFKDMSTSIYSLELIEIFNKSLENISTALSTTGYLNEELEELYQDNLNNFINENGIPVNRVYEIINYISNNNNLQKLILQIENSPIKNNEIMLEMSKLIRDKFVELLKIYL